MTTKKAEQKAVTKANEQAINCFPKAKIVAAMGVLAEGKAAANTAEGTASSASLDIVKLAADYGVKAHEIANGDTDTVLKDWKSNLRLVALELAAAGSPFAETTTNKAGETIGKLTGTGNNVLSIAKGVVDHRLVIDECTNEEGEVSYRSVRAVVEAKRAERRAEQDPEGAALNEAKADCREQWQTLSKLVFGTNDIGLIEDLTTVLMELSESSAEAVAKQAALDAEAEAKAKDDAATLAALEAEAAAEAEADAEQDAEQDAEAA